MIVLVTGDRAWDDLETTIRVLEGYPVGSTFVHGYADGLDCCVDVVARALEHTVIRCPAHWRHNCERWVEVYGPCTTGCEEIEGNYAGILRNQFMLVSHHPDIVLGFHNDILNSRGTRDMLLRAQAAGIKNVLYTSTGEEFESPVLTHSQECDKIDRTSNLFFNF